VSLSGLPFDDIRDLIANMPDGDMSAGQLAASRAADLSNVFGLQERHATLAEWLATWSGKSPNVSRPMLALFAGNHAISDRYDGGSSEDTLVTVTRLAAGGGTANQACASFDIGLKAFDLALQFPVNDIGTNDALDEKGSAATIGFGMEAIAGGVDLLGLAAFGSGSEISDAAFMEILLDKRPDDVNPDDTTSNFHLLVDEVVTRHGNTVVNPLELLRRVGGREHSAITGAILAARVNHVPAVLEGLSAASIVLLLQKINPALCDHCCFAALPNGKGEMVSLYREAIKQSNLHYVLDGFGVARDGANAALAIGVIKSVAAQHCDCVIDAS
jgi:nicotinate-nucleotide--dimethylbenzimidazole phosphoribosyltransferase